MLFRKEQHFFNRLKLVFYNLSQGSCYRLAHDVQSSINSLEEQFGGLVITKTIKGGVTEEEAEGARASGGPPARGGGQHYKNSILGQYEP